MERIYRCRSRIRPHATIKRTKCSTCLLFSSHLSHHTHLKTKHITTFPHPIWNSDGLSYSLLFFKFYYFFTVLKLFILLATDGVLDKCEISHCAHITGETSEHKPDQSICFSGYYQWLMSRNPLWIREICDVGTKTQSSSLKMKSQWLSQSPSSKWTDSWKHGWIKTQFTHHLISCAYIFAAEEQSLPGQWYYRCLITWYSVQVALGALKFQTPRILCQSVHPPDSGTLISNLNAAFPLV